MGELTAINKYFTQPYRMIFAVVHLRSSSMQSALQTADFDWHILKHSTSLPAFVVNHYHVPVVVPTCAAVPLSLAAAKLACLEPPALTSWPAPRGVASARCVGEVAHGHRPRGSVQPRWRIWSHRRNRILCAIGRSLLLKQIASVELWEMYENMKFRTGRYEINVYTICTYVCCTCDPMWSNEFVEGNPGIHRIWRYFTRLGAFQELNQMYLEFFKPNLK